jgi:hypothetical protein
MNHASYHCGIIVPHETAILFLQKTRKKPYRFIRANTKLAKESASWSNMASRYTTAQDGSKSSGAYRESTQDGSGTFGIGSDGRFVAIFVAEIEPVEKNRVRNLPVVVHFATKTEPPLGETRSIVDMRKGRCHDCVMIMLVIFRKSSSLALLMSQTLKAL